MFKITLTILLLIILNSVLAEQLSVDSNNTFSTLMYNSKQAKTKSFGYTFNLLGKYQILEENTLTANLDASVILEAGSFETLNINDFRPIQGLTIQNATVDYKLQGYLNFSFGAINQKDLLSPLLLTNTAFVGGRQKFNLGHFSFQIQELIPNNQSLSHRYGEIEETKPTFLIGTFLYRLRDSAIQIDANFSFFKYSDLSSQVAYESNFLGNSITGNSTENAIFLYKFSGYNLVANITLTVDTSTYITFKSQYLFNNEAPDSRNKGILGALSLKHNSYQFGATYFKNESDSSISFYNDKFFGHNNVQGVAIDITKHFPAQDFEVNFKYVTNKPIKNEIYKSSTNIILINLVKAYEIL